MNLLFSLPGIASNYCSECRQETMHKFCRCVHCGTRIPSAPLPQPKRYRGRRPALSPEKRREVIRKAVAGISPFVITAEYGISYTTFKRTLSGHR